jgi:hypothetical protein
MYPRYALAIVAAAPRTASKKAQVLAMICRAKGASLAEIMKATGGLAAAHRTRLPIDPEGARRQVRVLHHCGRRAHVSRGIAEAGSQSSRATVISLNYREIKKLTSRSLRGSAFL